MSAPATFPAQAGFPGNGLRLGFGVYLFVETQRPTSANPPYAIARARAGSLCTVTDGSLWFCTASAVLDPSNNGVLISTATWTQISIP